MSFVGSAQRLWRPVRRSAGAAAVALGVLMTLLILTAWIAVIGWYLTFGLLVVPWRLIRRGQRKEKRNKLQHRELLDAINQQQR